MDACLTYIPSVRFHPDAAKRCLKRHGKDSRLSSEGYPCKPLYCRQLEALYKGAIHFVDDKTGSEGCSDLLKVTRETVKELGLELVLLILL